MTSFSQHIKLLPPNPFASNVLIPWKEISQVITKYKDLWASSSSQNYRKISDWWIESVIIFNYLYQKDTKEDYEKWCKYNNQNPTMKSWLQTTDLKFIKNRKNSDFDVKSDRETIIACLKAIEKEINFV